jgi:oligosaccharide repeat unit polymerase
MTAVVLLVVLGAHVLLRARRGNGLDPALIWSTVWLVAVALFALRLLPYRELSWRSVVLIVAATAAFDCGTRIGERFAPRLTPSSGDRAPHDVERAARWVSAAAFAGLAVFVAQVWREFGFAAVVRSSPEVRDAVNGGGFSIEVKYVYATFAAAALVGIVIARAGDRRGRLMWTAVGIGLVLATYFTTGRSNIVTAALVLAVSTVAASSLRVRPRHLAVGVIGTSLIAAAVLFVGGELIGKTFEASEISTIDSVFARHDALRPLGQPYLYATAALPALEVVADGATTFGRHHGCSMLAPACSVLRRVGIDAEPVARIRPFTAPPVRWNTYTSVEAPLEDFGLAFVWLPFAVAGVVAGVAFLAATRRTPAGIAVYAITVPAIVTAIGNFNFSGAHLVGAALIALVALRFAPVVRGAPV